MPNLVEVIKKAAIEAVNASNPAALVIGVVISENPLQILVEQRLTLDEDFLILTKHVTDHYVDMTVSHMTDEKDVPHSHDISGETSEMNVDAHTHSVTIATSEGSSSVTTTGTSETTHKHSLNIKSGSSTETEHPHSYKGRKKILLHYGLKQGESVLLIKMQGGQKYIVLDRIGNVPVKGEWIE